MQIKIESLFNKLETLLKKFKSKEKLSISKTFEKICRTLFLLQILKSSLSKQSKSLLMAFTLYSFCFRISICNNPLLNDKDDGSISVIFSMFNLIFFSFA